MAAHRTSATSTQEVGPEMQLVLACARKTLNPDDAKRIFGLCHDSLDWQLFLRLINRHRVLPLVWHSLKSIDNLSIPSNVRGVLNNRAKKDLLSAFEQAAELTRLIKGLEGDDIRVLSLKGPILAMQAYETLKLRHSGDLDLLVDQANLWDADRILQDSGYVRTIPDYPLSPGQAAAYMKIRKDFSYTHPKTASRVELHWRLCQNRYLFPLGINQLWPEREFISLGNTRVAAIPRQELLLYLCAHGAHTGWFRLKWLCDIAELTGNDHRNDMPQVFFRAEELGVTRMLAQGLILAHQLLNTPLPASLSTEIRQDRTVQSMVSLAVQALSNDEHYWSADNTPVSWMATQVLYRMKLRSDIRYKLNNFYFYTLWRDEVHTIHLPKLLSPLYFVLSLFFWFLSLFKR